jgi:hypothetical protein
VASLTGFFMLSHEIFRFENDQYEIREFVFIYAMSFWLYQSVSRLKRSAGSL